MLARQLVDAPFERLAETEIVAVQRQDTAPLDHLEQPIGERDLDFRHLAGAGLPHDPPFVDEAEPFGDFLAIGLDVRGDPRPRQALERAPQPVIAVDRKSTRLNSSHYLASTMPSYAFKINELRHT